MAVRLALGATRGRLQRQMLMESVLLGLGGGVLGVALSLWASHARPSRRMAPAGAVPLDVSVSVDWRVLLYSFVLSVACGLFLGLAPAWAAARPRLCNALKGEDALARPGRRISLRRHSLVVAQISVVRVVLLCITGLFLRSLRSAASIDLGFRSENLLMMSVDPRVHGYTPERSVAFLTQVQQRVAALTGIQSAVVTDSPPLNGGNRSEGFHLRGDRASTYTSVDLFMAAPGYFEVLGIPRIAGNDFGAESESSPKVAIVNSTFVRVDAWSQSSANSLPVRAKPFR